jgi:Xaa-Pro dipeptidase
VVVPPVGARIRQARTARGMSLRGLAREIGVSASLISQIETGKSQPSVSTLYAITTALSIPVESLFDAEGETARTPATAVVGAPPDTVLHALAAFAADPGRRIGPLVGSGEREVLELDSGVIWERLGHVPGADVDFLRVTYRPGGTSSSAGGLMRHPGTDERRRLGAARRPRPAAHRAAGPAPRRTGALRAGRAAHFDFANIRYMTSTHIGTWAMDKLIRFALLPAAARPIVWDFGSAARHHQLYNPWLDYRRQAEGTARPPSGARAGISTLRGAFHPDAGIAEDVARKVARAARTRPGRRAARRRPHRDAGPARAAGRRASRSSTASRSSWRPAAIKTPTRSAAHPGLLDGRRRLRGAVRFLRPGVRENECVGLVSKVLYDLGSEYVEGVNAISGERCSPHPHVYSDRLIRPATRRSSTSCTASPRLPHLLLPHVRGRQRLARPARRVQALPRVHGPGDRPGPARRDHRRHRPVWPRPRSSASRTRRPRSRCSTATASGLSIWEKPIFSRLVSLDHPEVLEEGMVFALETYWPAADGWSAGADRGGGRRHRRRLRGHHQVPGRGTPRRRAASTGRTTHLAAGHEAIAVGASAALRDDDYVFATYRGHHHATGPRRDPRGVPRRTDEPRHRTVRGQGRLDAPDQGITGMLGSYAIVGAHLPMAVGAAWSARLRGTEQVAVAFFGDGATNIGAFHEALNLAAVWKLPVLFVCENNLYMEYTPIADVTAVANPAADRAPPTASPARSSTATTWSPSRRR